MKKIVALMLALVMVFALASCAAGNNEPAATKGTEDVTTEKTDLEYVQEKGKLLVGVTDFAPMDYLEDGKWVGFDADLAAAFAKFLNVEVEFVEIEWESKVLELNNKNIDCVWNGMTLTDEVKAAMETSVPYCNNQQIVVVAKDVADEYQSADACKDLTFAVEAGSAGKEVAEENGFTFTEVETQAAALMEVKAGTCDAAIIDSLMAAAMVGEGTGYADLAYTVGLNDEQYGVGFRKGSDLAAALNDFLEASKADGTLETLAETYKVQAALIK